jgi:protocatechuate 3,4-dioxygenase beta subunit
MTKNARTTPVSRRDTLKVCLLPAAGMVVSRLLAGCGADDDRPAITPGADAESGTPQADADSSAASNDAAPGTSLDAGQVATPDDAAAVVDANGADANMAASDASVGPGMWAGGGTKSMQGGYPDPFTLGELGAACALYPAQTLGPCYAPMPEAREDISEGMTGLPMRLSFLVVRSDGCTPVPNASVDIWHCGSNGIYSAFRSGTTCNPGSTNVLSQLFCRGVQVTNAMGRTDFNTVFPGWYTGRTLHIHFTVRVDGREFTTSQLYWEDALVDEILAQGEYEARGKRTTTNSGDAIFKSGGASPQQVIFSTAKRADGALHAWKVLSIRGV